MAIDNKQTARRLIEELWSKGKVELLEELVDPNYEGRDPLLGVFKRDGLKENVKAYRSAFPDLKMDVLALIAEGNFVTTRWVARGTHLGPLLGMKGTGRSASITGINVGEFRNGKLINDVGEFDALGLMRQLQLEGITTPIPTRQVTPKTTQQT
jgi:predicted ester cyclase